MAETHALIEPSGSLHWAGDVFFEEEPRLFHPGWERIQAEDLLGPTALLHARTQASPVVWTRSVPSPGAVDAMPDRHPADCTLPHEAARTEADAADGMVWCEVPTIDGMMSSFSRNKKCSRYLSFSKTVRPLFCVFRRSGFDEAEA